ncbi:MAG: cysteine synthase A [Dehalococcoidales bacterium]|nr:cysteine synthase A [Dehalococcoidales bacterium]MDD5605421.1 cysteine synthase A [Dehalococcoidales bacterium]MDX9986457.1 cysteine synthase A [Dehalococcoidales bacterium]
MAHDATCLTGNTPLVRLNKVIGSARAEVVAKLEYFNPTGSVKDRTAVAMVLDAETKGIITKTSVIIEPTSGNTGIALAFVCAAKGYKLIIVMPENMSEERKKLLRLLGAELILTPAQEGMSGSVRLARGMAENDQNYILLGQFDNPANPDIHTRTTALEIWEDTGGLVDIVVAGAGTGGTVTGIGRALKKLKPEIQIIAVEPEGSPVLSGGKTGPHLIQGLGAGFIPGVFDPSVVDRIETVSNEAAINMTKRLAREEGLLAGLSSGAAVFVAVEEAKKRKNQGKMLVVILPDTGERYLSTWDA